VELAEKSLIAARKNTARQFKGHIVFCPDQGGHNQSRAVFYVPDSGGFYFQIVP
jgi:hypothetical protein